MNTTLKIRPLSDVHTEFGDYNVRPQQSDHETVLVLAGDIGIVHKASQLEGRYGPFLERCSQQFRHVVLVMGNHEHYDGSILRTREKLQSELARRQITNVSVLENEVVAIDHVAFIGATLWTDCDGGSPHASYLWNGMSDSKLIRIGPSGSPYQRKLMSTDTVSMHVKSKQFIVDAVEACRQDGLKTVIVVHHGVTHQSIPDIFRGDALNMFFVSEMTMDLMDANPDLVIHGHVHDTMDYVLDSTGQICQTRVICNPRGYVGSEDTGFNPTFVVEV